MASTTVLAPSQVTARRSPSPSFTGDSRRQSYVSSSAASFQTARTDPMGPGSHTSLSSRSSSAHTLGPREEPSSPYSSGSLTGINPLHTMSQQQHRPQANGAAGVRGQDELHIVKVTGDTVHLESGPMTDTFMQKVGHSISKAVPTLHSHHPSQVESPPPHAYGPPPPSPPASVEHTNWEEETHSQAPNGDPLLSAPKMRSSKTEPLGAGVGGKPITFEEPLSIYRDTRKTSTDSSNSNSKLNTRRSPSRQQTLPDSLHRSSTETRMSTSTRGRPSDEWSGGDTSYTTPEASSSKTPASTSYQSSPDGHLQPPAPITHPTHRPTRRNTTGSVPRPSTSSFARGGVDDGEERELESDIQMQAEAIRRERYSKKAKAREAEAAQMEGGNENQVLVGNLIGEDHVNYVLMYNMLTGIRIAVSTPSFLLFV